MLKNNKVNLVLAVLIAIALWAYVLGDVNPASSDVVRNVPIKFLNEESLDENGLVILSTSASSVNISISGQRTSVTRVDAGDFNVTADLDGLREGENVVRLAVSGPGDVKIENVNIEKITVVVDRFASEEKSVEAVINGETETPAEAHVYSVSAQSATVTGPATLVKSVERLVAFVDADDIGDVEKTFARDLVPVNSHGERVEGVTVSDPSSVEVRAVIFYQKTVELEVPVINQDEEDTKRTVSAPRTIDIKGTAADIENITRITCATVDLKDVNSDSKVTLTPLLPEGVLLADEEADLSMEVSVKTIQQRSFDFTADELTLEGTEDGLNYDVGQKSFKVTVTMSGKDSEELSKSDFTLSADVSGLKAGTHSVDIKASCGKDAGEIKVEPRSADVTIS